MNRSRLTRARTIPSRESNVSSFIECGIYSTNLGSLGTLSIVRCLQTIVGTMGAAFRNAPQDS
jgi:hypothetical protein